MDRHTDQGDGSFTLTVSALPQHVPWVRTFAAAVASAHGVSPDEVADLRLAVSELAAAIATASPGVDLDLAISRSDDRLVCSLRPCVVEAGPDVDLDPWDVVGALFEDARLVDGCAVFSILVPVPL